MNQKLFIGVLADLCLCLIVCGVNNNGCYAVVLRKLIYFTPMNMMVSLSVKVKRTEGYVGTFRYNFRLAAQI